MKIKRNRGGCRVNHDYEEIGEALGITPSGARLICIRALEKLRKGLEEAGLTYDDLLPVDSRDLTEDADAED